MMTRLPAILLAIFVACAAPSSALAQGQGRHDGYHGEPRDAASRHRAARRAAEQRRDPLGIIQRQGVSSLYGGMGNMGGGSGRSANTGVGLGAHGNSQGPRF